MTVDEPYFLILSSFMMPKMKGDEILKRARELAPDAQRMLLADTDDLDTLIKAINMAGIHACLTLPIKDDSLLRHVGLCSEHYEQNKKQKSLKRLTQHQNKQLFQIASNFKKKGDAYAKKTALKKKELRLLESRIRSAGGSVEPQKPVSMEQILNKRETGFSPDGFGREFDLIKSQVKQILEAAVSEHYISIDEISYDRVLSQALIENRQKPLVKKVLPQVLNLLEKGAVPKAGSRQKITEVILEEQFEISLKQENTKAFIKLMTFEGHSLSLAHVKQFLEKNKVINGVADDDKIEQWLYRSTPDDDPFLIARGRPARHPKDAQIRFHFPTEFLHAGKVNEDGSINFQDRGEIPYVEEGAFLAAKIFAEKGSPGIDVLGREILVEDAGDQTFSAGSGTRMSEDGVSIYATTAGQPHLDAMGNISVCPEYQVKGDIDFETGDVDFDGNVVVNGTVKEGFKVRCASLTATEIQGAHIDVEGDLNVSLGIVDTELVKVKGSVQAKFVHNSKINSFGDLIVTKEIIDSDIYLSGACINKTGLILNSKISAKMGIDAGNIGNKSSKPSTLTVGVDEHTNILVAKVDSKLNINNAAIADLKQEVRALQKEDHSLHASISQHAHVQDRAQLELKDIEKKMENLKASGNMAAYQKVSHTVKEIRKNAEIAEKKINEGFDRQDEISVDISQKNGRINEFEELNKELLDEKKRLLEFSDRKEPLPEVKVGRKIESETKIFSANASLTLYNSNIRCRIREYSRSPDGIGGMEFYEMKVGNY